MNADPQQVPAVMGDVVAQGDSNSIGCPIVVDGQVDAERISHEVNAYPQSLAQGA
jgi:Mycobacterium membrane protein